jgi:tetratricopeptide (TPR) repeat protein
VLLGAIALYEFTWWRERRQVRALLMAGAALLVPLVTILYQRAVILGASPKADFPFTDNPIQGAGFWAGKLTALKVLAHYLFLTFWPVKLSADYSYSQIPIATGTLQDWVSWIAIAAAIAVVIALYRVNRSAFFLACFAGLTLVPSSNLVFPIGTIMAERFLYLPAVGLIGCLVLAVYAIADRIGNAKVAPVTLSLIAMLFAVRTWARNMDWQDDVSLDTATVRAVPDSFKAHKMLAVALMESSSGETQIDREIAEARQSIALIDSLPDVRSDPAIYRLAATLYLKKGDQLRSGDAASASQQYRDALAALQRNIAILRAIASTPDFVNPETGRLLSVLYERLGDRDKAVTAAMAARQSDPLNPLMYRQLADAFLASGRPNDAATALMEGMIVTQDMDVRSELLKLYQSGIDTQGCALIDGPNGKAINPACAIIHTHLCAVAPDAIKVRLATGRRDIAEQMKRSFLTDYGCPAGPIVQAMGDKPGS